MWQPEIVECFQSKKNRVFRERGEHSDTVKKVFADASGFRTEKEMGDFFAGTDLTIPLRLSVDEAARIITYEYVNALPVVDFIERESLSQAKEMIEKICDWLAAFYRICLEKIGRQYIWGDIHLRNLIYEEKTGIIYGVDFEECQPGRIESDIARIRVFLLHYDPAFTERKKTLEKYLRITMSDLIELDQNFLEEEFQRETKELLARRRVGSLAVGEYR